MPESRLFRIVYYLLDKGRATAPELAEKFEVSVRTIYRDIDDISSAGVPIYVTTGRKGGIQLLDNYVLDKSLFTENEKKEILSGLQSLLAVQYPDIESTLNKLGAIFRVNLTDWIEVDFSRWGSVTENENKLFCQLKQSIFEKRQISFDYFSSSGTKESRLTQPLKLVYKDKSWYLYAFCLLRNDYRLFRISRIKNLVLTKIHFSRLIDNDITVYSQPYEIGPLINIELAFPLEVGYRLYDILDDSAIKQNGNGYHVILTLPESEWLYDFLMSFGDKVTIIRPESLKQKIIAKYKAALNHYKGV